MWTKLLPAATFFLLLTLSSCRAQSPPVSDKKLYILYMGSKEGRDPEAIIAGHHSLLTNVLGSRSAAKSSIVYHYKHSFSGFAATLTEAEYNAIAAMPGVISAFPSKTFRPQTTRSWEYLGLDPRAGAWIDSDYGANVVVATIDSGVWPESASFVDNGNLGPIPTAWMGICQEGENFTAANCNTKLIGARFYTRGYEVNHGPIQSPDIRSIRDSAGHGTHTTSTLAGSPVQNANIYGLAAGSYAVGGAPKARIASYKVCWESGCDGTDILAAFDDAVNDGVNVLSVSLGSTPSDYWSDSISVGSFHAVEHGVVVACSAGNDGPTLGTVGNVAPWIITVAASSMDRQFHTDIVLGNGATYTGMSLNSNNLPADTLYPIVYAEDIPAYGIAPDTSRYCSPGSLNAQRASGRIVVCHWGKGLQYPDYYAATAGAVGTVIITEGVMSEVPFMLGNPTTIVHEDFGAEIQAYIHSTLNAVGTLTPTQTVIAGPAPLMASFSARGPNSVTGDIFKPDITAPGVAILAAWSPLKNPSGEPNDSRKFDYNIISGTSMACPHVGGAAALLKSAHGNWSPAAIKSALMTTATLPDKQHSLNVDQNLAWGSGQVNPTAAMNPGLIFDAGVGDYIDFLCSLPGYNLTFVEGITRKVAECPVTVPVVHNLNYPSITASSLNGQIQVVRTATNVGNPASTYNVTIFSPSNVEVNVEPSVLAFTSVGQQLSYIVSLTSEPALRTSWEFGALLWDDGLHRVRTPIAVGPVSGVR